MDNHSGKALDQEVLTIIAEQMGKMDLDEVIEVQESLRMMLNLLTSASKKRTKRFSLGLALFI